MSYSETPDNELKLSQLMDGEWQGLAPSECVATLCRDEALRARWARYHIIRDVMKNEPVHADPSLASRICAAIEDEPVYSNITPLNSVAGNADNTREPVSASRVLAPGDDSSAGESDNGSAAEVQQTQAAQTRVDAARSGESRSWFHTGVTGFALAASVALVTVVGVNLLDQRNPAQPPVIAGLDNTLQNNTLSNTQALASLAGSDGQSGFVPDDAVKLPVVEFVANTGSYWVSPESSTRVNDEERLNMMLSQHIENSPTSSREGLLPYSRLVGYEDSPQEP